MRVFELKEDFNTRLELTRFGELVYETRIYKIHGDFKESKEWQDRIEKVSNLITDNI